MRARSKLKFLENQTYLQNKKIENSSILKTLKFVSTVPRERKRTELEQALVCHFFIVLLNQVMCSQSVLI